MQQTHNTTTRQTAAAGARLSLARPFLSLSPFGKLCSGRTATSAAGHEGASELFVPEPNILLSRSHSRALTAVVCLPKTSAPLRAALRLRCRRRRRRRLFGGISFFRISLQQKQFAFVFPRVRTRSRVCA